VVGASRLRSYFGGMRRSQPPFRDTVDAHVFIGWLADDPDSIEPDCPPIRLQYSKTYSASQSATKKGRGKPRSSQSKASKRSRSAGERRARNSGAGSTCGE
jgi:hypothetical protein